MLGLALLRVCYVCAIIGHYTKWLLAPAVLGVAVYTHQRAAGTFSTGTLPMYGIFVAVWAT